MRERTEREPHPREETSFLSYLSFLWTAKIFIRNVKETLTDHTLWKPYSKHASNVVGKELESSIKSEIIKRDRHRPLWESNNKKLQEITQTWENELEKHRTIGKKPSLTLAILKAFWFDFFIAGLNHLINSMSDVFIRPILLKYILNFFSPDSQIPNDEFYFAAVGMVIFSFTLKFMQAHYNFGCTSLGLKAKTACISLVYNKALKISQGTLQDVSSGHVVNLVSNDASRLDTVIISGNHIWSTPITVLIVCYQVYNEVGVSSVPGLTVIVIVAFIQLFGAKLTSRFRSRIAIKTGERIRLTEEILDGIRVIKMHSWEKPFYNMLHAARKSEMKEILKANLVRGFSMGFNLFTRRTAVCLTLVVYVLLGQRLNSALVYVLITYYSIMSANLTGIFVRGLQEIAETKVSIQRLEDFLMLDEIRNIKIANDTKNIIVNNNSLASQESDVAFSVNNVIASWKANSSDHNLTDINLQLKKGSLVMVVGSVASGKSSLLNLIIGELNVLQGEVILNGTISYSSQAAWIFGGTVKENILMGLPYDRKRYNEVIRVCCLERDLELFVGGDDEMVGERGAALSGGQRARINLARAVYKEADIYLFDDPLSAVDTHVANTIFQDCFQRFLKGKTVIVATHQIQFMKHVDHVVLLKDGSIEDQGRYDDLIEANHVELKSEKHAVSEVKEEPDLRDKMGFKWRSLQSVSSCDDSISIVSVISELEERNPVNRDSKYVYNGSPYLDYLKIGSSIMLPILFITLFVSAQGFASLADYFVNLWINSQEDGSIVTNSTANYEETVDPSSNDYYIGIYGTLILIVFLTAFTRGFAFFMNAQICSKKLHVALSKSVLYTDMSFFNDNPKGAILNRFTRDLNAADEILPRVFLESCQVFGMTAGSVVLTAVINNLLLIPFTLLSFVSYLLRKFFMKTSLNLKRLEGICRSPVFTHVSTTLAGLPTIRAHGSLTALNDQFNIHQDLHSSAVYSFQASQQGYSLLLDLLSTIYLAIVIFSFFVFNDSVRGADVGLALTQTASATSLLQMGLRAASETTSLMTCIERILAFVTLKPEESKGNKYIPLPLWPEKGKIEFNNVVLYYKESSPVLRKITFTINPGEKIGIVGRTGAGKSSIVQALFRFAQLDGNIFIDDINTRDIPLNILRSRIAIIPQEPVLFSGDVRKNLDPYSDYPDYVLLKVLNEIEVPDFLKDHGLDTRILDGGVNMSIGQRQLICLARAILRNSSVIVLDEATANVDSNTDALIQRIIRTKFADCTVLTIAHRLNTIMDSDRIMVLDGGRLVEFDEPYALLQKKRGYFYGLVRETGREMALDLIIQAQQKYWRKQQVSLEE